MARNQGVIFQNPAKEKAQNSDSRSDVKAKGFRSNPPHPSTYSKAARELDKLAKGSARIIFSAKTVFPFNFFPDELVVDETKVSLHTSYFFYTKQVRSIEYRDMFNVIINQSLFFANIEIIDRFFSKESIKVDFLWKKDAILARRIIQGMMIATKRNISIDKMPLGELLEKLIRIGQTR